MQRVPFHAEHFWSLEVDEAHNRDPRPALLHSPVPLEILWEHAWSVEHGGRAVACGGRSGIAWWMLAEQVALKQRVALTRIIRATLQEKAAPGDIAHAMDAESAEWLEVLGFVRSAEQKEPGLTRYEWP